MFKRKLTLSQRNAWTAQVFILPFYIGFWFFFLSPLIESLRICFSHVSVTAEEGYVFEWAGLENLSNAFFVDANFTTNLTRSISDMAWKIPIIIVLSLFMAMIINQKFHGRVFVRAVFFLPVIFASGVALSLISGDSVAGSALTGSVVSSDSVTKSNALGELLVSAGIDSEIIGIATKVADSLFSLVWRSGIQMIIFLAGLQSIPPTLYEASSIEGASAWENFWKVTLPMLTPTILINVVYTIVDTFTDASNSVMKQVINTSAQVSKLGLSSAFAWTYFAVIGVILLVIMLVFSKINKKIG